MHHVYNHHNLNMTLKLDMLKAFDCVNWCYLQLMLCKFHFSPMVINVLMKCVSTRSTTIHFNNARTSYFKPTRCLRQSDLVSPLLFVIQMEGFSAFIRTVLESGWWVPLSFTRFRNPPSPFASTNEFILFSKTTNKGLMGIQRVMGSFCRMSGQQINLNKSNFLLSNSYSNVFRQYVCSKLGVAYMPKDMLYLGIPLPFWP